MATEVLCQDFGGSQTMPSIGVRQASMEYYLSNLTWNSFHTYNCLTGAMDCQSYDERTAGKGADAMCSLRLWYYLHVPLISTQRPEHLIFIMDNCVGQNKSQDVMRFYALMSAVFYTTVTIIFLPPGHSHNAADRCQGAYLGLPQPVSCLSTPTSSSLGSQRKS